MINDSVYAGANDEMVLRNAPPSECNNLLRNSDFENDICAPGLIAFDGCDGTLYSSYGGLGCNKGGEGVSEGLFLLNDGSVDIELVSINVTGPRNQNPAATFDAEFNSHCF